VAALINAADGTVAANYEYGPFGEVIRNTGPMGRNNPFRFSTKYDDDESDLLYYGYRYYKPSTGTWASRDPIEEQGGPNLYGFVSDDSINHYDATGEFENVGNNNGAFLPYWDYILGIKSDIVMGPDDPWTQMMENHPHMKEVRDHIRQAMIGHCADQHGAGQYIENSPPSLQNVSDDFSLNEEGIGFNAEWMANDVLGYLTLGYLGHPRAFLTGSFRLRWSVEKMSCCLQVAKIKVQASDTLSFHSNFRIPLTNIGPPDNPIGQGAVRPFQNVPISWNWEEFDSFK
jgi:RHS repeat-associated protein